MLKQLDLLGYNIFSTTSRSHNGT